MVAPTDVPRRRNGLSGPYSAPQICSWLFLAATAIHFLLFNSTILPLEVSIPLTIFFFVLFGVVLHYGMKAIAVDSMDTYLTKALIVQRNGVIRHESNLLDKVYTMYNGNTELLQRQRAPENEETKQCWICDTQVAHHSMHCKYCNKCVSHFDHHCLWLNTCVGAKNYNYFFRVMLSISAMQIVHLGISLGLVVDIFLQGPTEERAEEWLGIDGSSEAIAAVLLFFIAFDFISLVLLAQLIAFHMHLQKERITTYQYIVQDGQRRREKVKLQMELHQRRETEIARAKTEGRPCYACRLHAGDRFRQWGCGACLDPLTMPQPAPEPDPNAGFSAALGGTTSTAGTPEQPTEFGGGGEDGMTSATSAAIDNVLIRNVESESTATAEEHGDENGGSVNGAASHSHGNHRTSSSFAAPTGNGERQLQEW